MAGIKELKEELSEMRSSMKQLTEELHETNLAIRDSLKMTSEAIKEASEKFSQALENTMERMSDLTIQMNIRDTILKSLGIDGMIPDFLRKKKIRLKFSVFPSIF
ncbi:MAG: hypothetical protein ACFFDF_24615 [Candidatus Odinarchaeota archaeon]